MSTTTYIQVTGDFATRPAAEGALAGILVIDGAVGGRVVEPSPAKPGWHAQAFLRDTSGVVLPEGARRVAVPDSMRAGLGIPARVDACGSPETEIPR